MRRHSKFVKWLTLSDIEPELAVAQFGELQRQVPLLYALLSVNAAAVAYTHVNFAPAWLSVWIPAALVSASMFRMVLWLRRSGQVSDAGEAVKQLRRTAILGAILAVAYVSWSLGLSRYGGDHEQTHIAIFIAITVIGCIFCLMPLPQAATAVATLVMVPSLYYYLAMDDTVYTAIGVNILLVTLVVMRVLFNSYLGFVQVVRSRTETERLNREVTLLANTDSLTLLPNRRQFFADLQVAMKQAGDGDSDLAIGIIDLDRFKAVNDTMGHLFGDQLLEAVGARLKKTFPRQGLISRLGGDEFAFQIELDGDAAVSLANKICEALSEPYKIGEMTVTIGATCGLATLSNVVGSGDSLYTAADYALYNAKSERRGFATLYSANHEAQIRSERAIEVALQSADLDSEMDVHFQPIVHGPDGAVRAVEALARWTSPTLGRVDPGTFIPLAERTGIVHRLTQTLFGKALKVAERLRPDLMLSFNLSAHDLTIPETVLSLVSLIGKSSVSPSRILFELTETAVMRDFAAAEEAILLLRGLGVQIALDDFGTGQSSLSYLRRLQIDKIKIDRSFIADAKTEAGCNLLAAIVALCAKMKIGCVAEGVETSEQLRMLRDLGCETFQGYYFSKPLPASELMRWLEQNQGACLEPRIA